MRRTQGVRQLDVVEVDALDRAILLALAEDAGASNKALATRLGMPESTCAYRVRALRRRGVLRGTRLVLDPGRARPTGAGDDQGAARQPQP